MPAGADAARGSPSLRPSAAPPRSASVLALSVCTALASLAWSSPLFGWPLLTASRLHPVSAHLPWCFRLSIQHPAHLRRTLLSAAHPPPPHSSSLSSLQHLLLRTLPPSTPPTSHQRSRPGPRAPWSDLGPAQSAQLSASTLLSLPQPVSSPGARRLVA